MNEKDKKLRRKLRIRKSMYDFLKESGNKFWNTYFDISLTKLENLAKTVAKQRQSPNTLIDQCHISPCDLAQRTQIILKHLPFMPGKNILFVGDDDLTSVVLSNISSCFITVIDIDERILNTIKNLLQSDRTNLVCDNLIEIRRGQKTDPLDGKFFDGFVTDPPYTEDGFITFLDYGIKHLKIGGKTFVAVPHLNFEDWTDELLYKIENFLLLNGCVIEEIIPAAAVYEHDDEIFSSLLIAKKVMNLHSSRPNQIKKSIYTTGYKCDL